MAFRYPLQSVLRLRRSLERQEELRLFQIAAVVTRIRAEIEQLDSDHFDQRRQFFEAMALGTLGAVLQFNVECDLAYTAARRSLQAQLEKAEQERLAQLHRYQQAYQKREMFEGLRDRQKAVYDLDFARHQQQLTDEAFLLRLSVKATE